MRRLRALPVLLATPILLSGCFGYRLMRPEEIELPNYDPRAVPIPAECEALIERTARQGMVGVSEAEGRYILFCQQQQIIRSQEEAAAAKRLESHARAADFALHLTTVLITATVAVLTWVF